MRTESSENVLLGLVVIVMVICIAVMVFLAGVQVIGKMKSILEEPKPQPTQTIYQITR